MNTVDSLNKFGKALCGDAYESTPGLTDAEAISKIADSILESGGISGNVARHIPITVTATTTIEGEVLEEYHGNISPNLTARDLANSWLDLNYGPLQPGEPDFVKYVPVLLIVHDLGLMNTIDLYSMHDANEILRLAYNRTTGEISSSANVNE